MKAIIYSEYGSADVLRLAEVAKPVPKDNEVLIRVHATSVNFGDLMARDFAAVSPRDFNMPLLFWLLARVSFGLSKPKATILGNEFAGEIEAVGQAVQRFKPGDQVFGYPGLSFGAYAEYLCMAEDGVLALKPANMTYEEAAVAPYGATMALSLLRRANIQPGQQVLINGASGAIGSAAVQLAKLSGAEVTGVCGAPRLEFVRALGADKVIDYATQDVTRNGETYDLIFDVLGKASYARFKRSLKPTGILLYASFKMKQLLQMAWTSLRGGRRVICALAPGDVADLLAVKALIEAGKFRTLVDRSFPLEQVAAAHRYVEQGARKGNVAITITPATRISDIERPSALLAHA